MRLSIFGKRGGSVLAAAILMLPVSAAAIGSSTSAGRSMTAPHRVTVSEMRDVAANNGRADGRKAGRSDKQKHAPKNYAAHAVYTSALRGYKPRMGSAEKFKVAYRKAFENGYDAGYNGY